MRSTNPLLSDTMARLHRNYLDILRRRIGELRKFAARCRDGDIDAVDIDDIHLRVRNLASSGAVYGYINVSEAARPLDRALNSTASPKALAKYAFDLIKACELTLAGSETTPPIEKFPRFKPTARQANYPFPVVLTVDDDPAIHDLIQAMFHDYAHIVTAYTGDEALDAVCRHCPDLILLDNVMPGSGGIKFLEQLVGDKELSLVPIIMLTADDQPHDIMRATTAGVTDYITKPFDPQILGDHISSLLGWRRA